MEEKNNLPKFGLILAAGSLWGIVEFGAGMLRDFSIYLLASTFQLVKLLGEFGK